jgi:glucosamine--fructose-6-phosphate aminotransferase (isomerizing)
MCGIIGYVGKKAASPVLLEGLRRLEYRGYDSAGLSVMRGQELRTRKKKGKIDDGLARLLTREPLEGCLGLATPAGQPMAAPRTKIPTPITINAARSLSSTTG